MTSAFQALYCFLQQPEWIDLCLRGGPGGGIDMPPLCLHAAISCVKDQLTARLTAGACWAQLCHLAVRRQQQPDVPVHTPYCEQAASSECMAALVDVLAQGVKVSCWFEECTTDGLPHAAPVHLYVLDVV